MNQADKLLTYVKHNREQSMQTNLILSFILMLSGDFRNKPKTKYSEYIAIYAS